MAGLDGTGKTQPTSRSTRFSEILKLKKAQEEAEVDNTEQLLPPDITVEPPTVSVPRPAVMPVPAEVETKVKAGRRGKVAKRGNPDYMQAIFHLPVKTSKRLDRELLDLGEAGVDLDRSEFALELLESFFRLSEQVGATEALKQIRSLGSE